MRAAVRLRAPFPGGRVRNADLGETPHRAHDTPLDASRKADCRAVRRAVRAGLGPRVSRSVYQSRVGTRRRREGIDQTPAASSRQCRRVFRKTISQAAAVSPHFSTRIGMSATTPPVSEDRSSSKRARLARPRPAGSAALPTAKCKHDVVHDVVHVTFAPMPRDGPHAIVVDNSSAAAIIGLAFGLGGTPAASDSGPCVNPATGTRTRTPLVLSSSRLPTG